MAIEQASGLVVGTFSASGTPTVCTSVELAGQIIGSSVVNGYAQPFVVPLQGLIVGTANIRGMPETTVHISGDFTGTSNILGNMRLTLEDSIGLYVSGPVLSTGLIPFNVWGHDDVSGNLTNYIQGCVRSTGYLPFFTHGFVGDTKSLNLYMRATYKANSGMPLYSEGHIETTKGLTLYMNGAYNGIVGSFPLYIYNTYSDGDFPLYTRGTGGLAGGQLFSTALTLFINREGNDSCAAGSPLFLKTITSELNSYLGLYLEGAYNSTSGIPLVLSTINDTKAQSVRLYTHGF